jgi:nickel transport protein
MSELLNERRTYAVMFHKNIFDWSQQVTRPMGHPFEVVPLDGAQPISGRPMRVQVLQGGRPVAGVRLGQGVEEKPKDPVTDAAGMATFVPGKGFNRLWARVRVPLSKNLKYRELSYEFLLRFIATSPDDSRRVPIRRRSSQAVHRLRLLLRPDGRLSATAARPDL